MITKQTIFPIAIGTYGLGAPRTESWEDKNDKSYDDSKDLESLMRSFESGMNYIDTSYIYAGGQTMQFLKKFFKLIPRDKIFIAVKIEKFVESKLDIESQINKYLQLMGLDFADSILLHVPIATKLPLDETYYEMSKFVQKGLSKHLSVSNLSLNQLKLLVEKGKFDIFSFEGLYNLECKINEDIGIIQYCKDHDIAFICYQPLRRNRTANKNYPLLVELSNKYNKTQNQIILNWIIKEKKLIAMIKAGNEAHLKENLGALKFDIDKEDLKKLNEFRNKEFDNIEVDWEDKGGVSIYKLATQLP